MSPPNNAERHVGTTTAQAAAAEFGPSASTDSRRDPSPPCDAAGASADAGASGVQPSQAEWQALRQQVADLRAQRDQAHGQLERLSRLLPGQWALVDGQGRTQWATQALDLGVSAPAGPSRHAAPDVLSDDTARRLLAQLVELPERGACSAVVSVPAGAGTGDSGSASAAAQRRTQVLADRADNGALCGALVHIETLSADTAAERDRRRALARLQATLDASTQVSIIATDLDGRITLFNRGAEALLGHAAEDVVGRMSVMDMHDRDELRARAAELTTRLGRPVRAGLALVDEAVLGQEQRYTYIRKNGSRVPVALAVTAKRGDDGEVTGFVGIAQDVSERQRHEQALHEAMQEARRASQSKSQFLANMSHEIRTPMNAVVGLTHLLAHTPLDADQHELLGKLQVASQSLLGLIDNVLDIARIEAGEVALDQRRVEPQRLVAELRAVHEARARAAGLTFHASVDPRLEPALWGDADRIRQVLGNLLDNAIKFTRSGSIHLHLEPGVQVPDPGWHAPPVGADLGPDAQGAATPSGASRPPTRPRLCATVTDTGIGIDPEHLDDLFQPFVQVDDSSARPFGGTGLGLFIARRLATLMGGTLEARSALGEGSSFRLELPLDPLPDASGAMSGQADAEPSLAGLRLLVVDDNDINREVAARSLSLRGARVVAVGDGEQCLRQLALQPDGFDAVVMDVQMPLMDGHETTRRIRQMQGLRQLPVIALTAGVSTIEHQRAVFAGMNAVVGKPFDPRVLVRCILRHLPELPEGPAPEMPAPAPEAHWPEIDGIDARTVRERLHGDLALFHRLLRRLLEDAVGLAHLGTADATTLAACLHRLKGAAATLGHAALADAAADAELLWRCDGQPAPRATAAAMQALDAVVAQVGVLAERAAPFLAAGDADGWPMVISRTGAGPSSRLNTADQAAPVRAPNGSQEPAGAAEGEPPGEAAATAANAAGATAITPSTERVASDRLQALMGAMLRADLVAQVHFDALKPWLRQRLAAPAFQALCAQFDALDYAGALPVLKALAESQAPTD